MPPPPPIRVGFIGLSKTGWATGSHLPYLQATPRFEIVAVCNTSVESAKVAIEQYKLGPGTKAYGSVEDIAADSTIDLIVASVRVDRHATALTPSLLAGKRVYVEWPLAESLPAALELQRLATSHASPLTAVGLQGRFAPVITKLKALVADGRVGKLLSSSWVGYAGNGGESESVAYLADRRVGGNLVTIHFGHAVDYVQEVLGPLDPTTAHTLLSNRRPTIKLLSPTGDGSVLDEHHPKTSHDHILTHATLASSDKDSDGAPVSLSLRGGAPFPTTPALDWRIYGSRAEIRVTASSIFLQIGADDTKISVHDYSGSGSEAAPVDVSFAPEADDEVGRLGLPLPAQNVGRLYEAIAAKIRDGKEDARLVDFGEAVRRHEFIDAMYRQNE